VFVVRVILVPKVVAEAMNKLTHRCYDNWWLCQQNYQHLI